jgi:20S proteasome subunit beta 5
MNGFVERFSTTNPISQLRRAQRLTSDDDGEEFSDAAWGSEAGFGNLTKGLPTFTVPDVPDVSPPNHLHNPDLCKRLFQPYFL